MPDRLEPGDPERIGEFWLSGRLGAGGQGVVYDAYGPDGARVAVKVLHGAQESPDELARMAAEARAAQRVASFCTARILQVRLEPPRPYIVSEYIDGRSLQAAVGGTADRTGRRFGGDDLHRLGIGIATALTAIHQAKVVHRDLKPGNVLLGPDGPRLIDFGIARVLDTHSATQSGFAGTLRYVAPEVYAGERAGAEADVFAWGAIMVFAATGKHAFPGSGLPEIAHQIRTRDIDVSGLPDPLRPLVAAALAKDPLERPSARTILAALTGDPREGAGDLADLVAGGAAQAGPHSRWEPGDPALGRLAEDAYTALPPTEQVLVPEVFLRCVVPGEDGSLATRPVAAAELFDRQSPDEVQALRHVVQAFHPLLAADTADQGQIVLTRPALLRAWPRLRGWIETEREALGTHHRIRQAARTWAAHGHRRSDVLTGAHLDEAVHWTTATDHQPSLNRLERGLLEASTRARSARSRRVRVAAVVLAMTTVLSLAATGWAVRAQQTASRQRDVAASRQLAAQSRQFGSAAPGKAALLAVAAGDIRETPESRAALRNIVGKPGRGVLLDYKANPVAVAADRSGQLLALGNDDGTVALWDVREHRRIGGFLRLFTPADNVVASTVSVALSPDGRTLAAAHFALPSGADRVVKRVVRLWDVRTRRPLGDLPVTSRPSALVFTSDGTRVAVDNGKSVALWDVRTRRRRGPSIPHPESTDAYTVIGPGATTMVTGTNLAGVPPTMEVWDLTTGRLKTSFDVKGEAVAVSPDGRTVATTDVRDGHEQGSDVYLWDTRTGRRRGTPIYNSSSAAMGPFTPDGRAVIVGTQLWTVDGVRIGSIATGLGGTLRVMAFAGEDTVVSLGQDGSGNTVRLWDITVHQPDHHPFDLGRTSTVRAQGSTPDGQTLIVYYDGAAGPSVFHTWDVTTGEQTRPAIPMPSIPGGALFFPERIAVAPDGKTFAVTDLYGRLRLWDPAARRWFRLEGGPSAEIAAMAFSPDGRTLATGGGFHGETSMPFVDGKVQLWDVRKHALITKKPLFSSGTVVSALAFSSDGGTLAAGIGQTVRLFDVPGRKRLGAPISEPTTTVNVLAFARDGRTLAIGGTKTTVLVDVRDRHQIGTPITGHTGRVTALAFSPDGRTLATGGDDHEIKLWETTGQTQIGASLMGHTGEVTSLAFDSGGKSLLSRDSAATVRRWNTDVPADPAATACAIAGRTLTRAEWAQYVPPGIDYRDICPALSRTD